MNVVLACTVTPFSASCDSWFFHPLARMLESAGHTVEALKFPYIGDAADTLDQRLAFRLTDVAARSDALIAIGAPACCLRHRNKIVWLDSPPPATPATSRREKEAIRTGALADAQSLREAQRVFAASRVLAERWRASLGEFPDVLYPSVAGDASQSHEEAAVFHVIAGSQYRTDLFLQTQEYVRETVRFVHSDTISPSFGLLYLPVNEACYSATFAEAVANGKCVITAADAGAAAEFARHDPDGMAVVPPEPAAIASAIDAVVRNQNLARSRAEPARQRMRTLAAATAEVLLS